MLAQPDKDGIYVRVAASPGRRGLALAMLYGLAVMLGYLALNAAAHAVGVVVLLAFAALALWAGETMRRRAVGEIWLTETALVHSDGTVLAALDDIAAVSRGAFAIKPSNGFTLKLHQPAPRAWAPGLWWRVGRRVGVGGVVTAGASRFMAEQISLKLAARAEGA